MVGYGGGRSRDRSASRGTRAGSGSTHWRGWWSHGDWDESRERAQERSVDQKLKESSRENNRLKDQCKALDRENDRLCHPVGDGDWWSKDWGKDWACGCGFMNFAKRVECLKCKKAKEAGPAASQGGGSGSATPATWTIGKGKEVVATGGKAMEELAFWQGVVKMHKRAEATGQAELLAMAEAQVAGLDKQVKAGRPLPARYQAAEAKVTRALAMQDAALAKVVAMEAALEAGVKSLQETMDALVEAQQDLAATKLELDAPSPPQKEEGLAEVIQGAVNGLIQKGALVSNSSEVLCAEALAEVVAELLEAKGKPPIPRWNEEMG